MATWRTTVQHSGTFVGGPGYNVFHLRDGDSGDPLVDLEQGSAALDDFYATIRGLFPSASTFSHNGEWVNIDDATELLTDPWEVDGSATQSYAPSQTCIVAGWRTAVRTRSGRGRTFLGPPATVAMQADGTPTTDAVNTVATAGNALIASLGGINAASWVVYSPTQNLARDMTTCVVRDVFAHLSTRRA